MSDEGVFAALRSDVGLVAIEAPAGCGKTFQGAGYARDSASDRRMGITLVLTHTHAACSVFANSTAGCVRRVEIRTIDSLIGSVAAAYHQGLGLPADIAEWIRRRPNGHAEIASMVATLVKRHPMIPAALARRYPIVICDEHQDSSTDQHDFVMSLHAQGTLLRVFADPMQTIYADKGQGSIAAWDWESFKRQAQRVEHLDVPHRWKSGCSLLGAWTLAARKALMAGRAIDLRESIPPSVTVLIAENVAQRAMDVRLARGDRKIVEDFRKSETSLLILTRHNRTARSLRSFFYRSVPLWEGHTRPALERLVEAMNRDAGQPGKLAAAIIKFLNGVGSGFSASSFGRTFEEEAAQGCVKPRKGKPARLQELAQFLVDKPDHVGVSRVLRRLAELRKADSAFAPVKIDCNKEYWEAVSLERFESPDEGLAEITRRRSNSYSRPPPVAISIVHKAKGFECDSVILMPCDSDTFPDKPDSRCLLYVALSRATSKLLLVLSKSKPSPLFRL